MNIWNGLRNFVESKNILKLNTHLKESSRAINERVVGPKSSINAHIPVFDGANGKKIKDGGQKLSDYLPKSGGEVTGKTTFDAKTQFEQPIQVSYPGRKYSAYIATSSIENEYIFGGSNNSDYNASCYVRVAQDKLQYKDGTNTYNIWHSGNDGAGSGLDANLIGGVSNTDVMRYIGSLPSSANFNDFTAIGIWHIGNSSNMSNDPGVSWATLIVTRALSYRKQEVYNHDGNSRYWRFSNGSVWSSWAAY